MNIFEHFERIVSIYVICFLLSGNILSQQKIQQLDLPNYLPITDKTETILARVGNKTITVKEFYERAEFTIRPKYAKGDSELEKKIILNSLIAEKLLVLERGKESKIFDSIEYHRIIRGRKEQIMRQLLFIEEGYKKVKIDSAEFVHEYKMAGRTYDLEFINFSLKEEAEYVANQLRRDSISIEEAYYQLTGERKTPQHKLAWNSPEYPEINDLLFNDNVKPNQILGPIKLPESYLVVKVKGWTDKPAITTTEQQKRYKNVNDKMRVEKGTKEFIKFIRKVMKGKKLEFNKNVFKKLVNILAPAYQDDLKNSEEEFAANHLNKKNDIDKKFIEITKNIEDIADEALFTIDGKIWTVGMFDEERKIHPLVFPSKDIGGKKFSKALKMAIVDMIQDKYLNQVAYEREYDKAFITKRITNMWSDAMVSMFEQIQMIKENNLEKAFSYENVNEFFTPYIDSLQRKYADQIEINIDEYNKLKLTSIDFVALQKNVPYPIIVPAFPQITTDHHLDYGKVMNLSE